MEVYISTKVARYVCDGLGQDRITYSRQCSQIYTLLALCSGGILKRREQFYILWDERLR